MAGIVLASCVQMDTIQGTHPLGFCSQAKRGHGEPALSGARLCGTPSSLRCWLRGCQISAMIEIEVEMESDVPTAEAAGAAVSPLVHGMCSAPGWREKPLSGSKACCSLKAGGAPGV